MDNSKMDVLQSKIVKGERIRIMFDLILQELEMNYNTDLKEVLKAMQEAFKDEQEATSEMATIIKMYHQQNGQTTQ